MDACVCMGGVYEIGCSISSLRFVAVIVGSISYRVCVPGFSS